MAVRTRVSLWPEPRAAVRGKLIRNEPPKIGLLTDRFLCTVHLLSCNFVLVIPFIISNFGGPSHVAR